MTHFEVFRRSEFEEKSRDGTSTQASIWHGALLPWFACRFQRHFESHACQEEDEKIVNLLSGSRRGKSNRRLDALHWRGRCPIFSLHDAAVGCGTPKRDAVTLIVCAHAREGAAASDAAPGMVDMRRFEV